MNLAGGWVFTKKLQSISWQVCLNLLLLLLTEVVRKMPRKHSYEDCRIDLLRPFLPILVVVGVFSIAKHSLYIDGDRNTKKASSTFYSSGWWVSFPSPSHQSYRLLHIRSVCVCQLLVQKMQNNQISLWHFLQLWTVSVFSIVLHQSCRLLHISIAEM